MSVFKLFNLYNNNVLGYQNLLRSRISFKYDEQQALISSRILEKLGLPSPPKRPSNIYIKFAQILRPKLLMKQPDMLIKDMIKTIAIEWNKYDPEQKKLMQKEYNLLKENYLLQMKKYEESITEEQQNLIKKFKEKEKRTKELIRIQEKKISMGQPRKPVSTFFMFAMEKKNQRQDNMKQTVLKFEWLKLLSNEWKSISESDKEKYRKKFKLESDKYKSNLITWQENMIRQGHTDIVKPKNLLHITLKKKLNKKLV